MTIERTHDIEVRGTKLHMLEIDKLQECGECKACCTVIGVQELNKPNYKRCDHLCGAGCRIYDSKPQSCTEYQCWFKAGLVKHRPDRIGVIVDFQMSPLPGSLRIWEVWEGAAETKRGKALIRSLCDKYECEVWLATRKWTTNLKSGFRAATPSEVALPKNYESDVVEIKKAFVAAAS